MEKDFKALFNDSFEFEIEGVKLKARILNIGDFAQLATDFPTWETDDISDLLSDKTLRFKAILRILELGIQGQNPGFPDEELGRLFTMRRIDDLRTVVERILDFEAPEVAPGEDPKKEAKPKAPKSS